MPRISRSSRRRGGSAVLISHDQDFAAILATTGASGPSLVNVRVSQVMIEELSQRILAVSAVGGVYLESGAIITIDDSGVRMHRLPPD